MNVSRLQKISFRFMPIATIVVQHSMLRGHAGSYPEADTKGNMGASMLTCVCLGMLEGRLAHEAVVSAGKVSVTCLLMGANSKIERFLPVRRAHLFLVNKGWGKTWCLADWIMWQRVSKRHFLLQQRIALSGNL